ncbi:MAG: hypothetical protein Q7R79_05110, partial [bacterium]|nr:hypothetical protein [bacterium]
LFFWPEVGGYLQYDKQHPTAPFTSEQIERWFSFLNDTIRDIKNPRAAQEQYDLMVKQGKHEKRDHDAFVAGWQEVYAMTTIRVIDTQEVIREFKLDKSKLPASFLKKEKTLVFEPDGLKAQASAFRTDPYAGMLCAFDNLFCRDQDKGRVLNLILRAKNVRLGSSGSRTFIDIIHNTKECPFMIEQNKETATKHLAENQCPFTRAKQQRIYAEVADAIIFDDNVYYK